MMPSQRLLETTLIGAAAVLFAGANLRLPDRQPVVAPTPATTAKSAATDTTTAPDSAINANPASRALTAFASVVHSLSTPKALESAVKSYFAFKSAHPDQIKKPLLYFVDYGLPSTRPRGYVLDMSSLKVVEGPFTVAHGRGSSTSQYGLPTRFSNAFGSAATSLGLYVTKALYAFTGHTAGSTYSSIGLRLQGVSTGFNDNAFARGVVAHGAPYVTADKAGRSQGCPAMEPARAKELLPKLADGAMVYLVAPDQNWMSRDPWLAASN
ncbi:MAG TPA: murein L,D-transpeptidase catalytic domain family protein [Gemmatimonadaceae bacterium]